MFIVGVIVIAFLVGLALFEFSLDDGVSRSLGLVLAGLRLALQLVFQ